MFSPIGAGVGWSGHVFGRIMTECNPVIHRNSRNTVCSFIGIVSVCLVGCLSFYIAMETCHIRLRIPEESE